MFDEKFATEIGLPRPFFNQLMALNETLGDLSDLEEKLFNPDYPVETLQKEVEVCAHLASVHPYTFSFYLLFFGAEKLYDLYVDEGIETSIFFHTMKDLTYKLKECEAIHGISGTFVFFWYPDFYRLKRFALGRFQYDVTTYEGEPYHQFGLTLKKGDVVYNLHIPSSGSINKAARFDSYQQACHFFKTDRLVVCCHTWLLNPHHRDFLNPASHIIDFMTDFDLVSYHEQASFHDAWRIFGRAALTTEITHWPEATSLQQAYKKYLLEKGSVGEGFGIFVFDGEKMINK
ncbi:MAG: acyltransferase domain-containing protein [Defluviitaleaceae bacterium]|nr:acyltransferase domain-containing protein [Defluviitaleaceae bacterium]